VFFHSFWSGPQVVAVHAYKDEAAYNAIVNDPNGPFAAALAAHKLEEVSRWIGSEKGTALED
jgi:hypothetical protein